MLAALLLVVAGFAALYQGGNALLAGASGLARKLGVPPLIVGLTVVAFATSAPELAVSVVAAVHGTPDIAVGNVLGSNIFNILVVVGSLALLGGVRVDKGLYKREIPVGIGALLLTGIFAFTNGQVERWEGAIMASLLGLYLFMVVKGSRIPPEEREALDEPEEVDEDTGAAALAIGAAGSAALLLGPQLDALLVPLVALITAVNARLHIKQPGTIVRSLAMLFGLGLLVFGSDILVQGARTLALSAGISEATVGLTLVALGTSAPELATGLVAARRGDQDLGVGGALGSNLFNLFAVLAVAAIITPVPVSASFLEKDIWVAFYAAASLLPFLALKRFVPRWGGALMLLSWIAYIVSMF